MVAERKSEGAIVDAHVHLYDCFDVHGFLSGASHNLRAAAASLGRTHAATSVLMLTETNRENGFDRLLQLAESCRTDGPPPGCWSVQRIPNDPAAVAATSADGTAIIVVAGRQIISSEGLEVLALGTDKAISNGASLAELVDTVNSVKAIPVIPWGVGKWLGRRGQVVKSFIESPASSTVFLGDILGRPVFWPRSSVFRRAAARGIDVLPGTDPLPLETETPRAGSCGFYIDCDLASGPPSVVLKEALRVDPLTILPFIRRESTWRFFRNQARMRLQ